MGQIGPIALAWFYSKKKLASLSGCLKIISLFVGQTAEVVLFDPSFE